MIVRELVDALHLDVVAGREGLERPVSAGYSADLLSCVMARAKTGNIWTTLQAHPNVIAVAALLDLAAIIVTEGAAVTEDVIAKADAEKIPLLATPHTTFWVVVELARLGVTPQE